jgi:hypothetical protein
VSAADVCRTAWHSAAAPCSTQPSPDTTSRGHLGGTGYLRPWPHAFIPTRLAVSCNAVLGTPATTLSSTIARPPPQAASLRLARAGATTFTAKPAKLGHARLLQQSPRSHRHHATTGPRYDIVNLISPEHNLDAPRGPAPRQSSTSPSRGTYAASTSTAGACLFQHSRGTADPVTLTTRPHPRARWPWAIHDTTGPPLDSTWSPAPPR